MENATKALLIASGVFLGIIIISLGVYLYSSLGSYVETTNEMMEENALNKFNTQFYNYINCNSSSGPVEFELGIQDVITVASIAYENNQKYELLEDVEYNKSTFYVTVNLDKDKHLEKNINSISSELLKNNLNNKYKCTSSSVKVSSITGRVYEITFQKI